MTSVLSNTTALSIRRMNSDPNSPTTSWRLGWVPSQDWLLHNLPSPSTCYIAGPFNNWTFEDHKYQLSKIMLFEYRGFDRTGKHVKHTQQYATQQYATPRLLVIHSYTHI